MPPAPTRRERLKLKDALALSSCLACLPNIGASNEIVPFNVRDGLVLNDKLVEVPENETSQMRPLLKNGPSSSSEPASSSASAREGKIPRFQRILDAHRRRVAEEREAAADGKRVEEECIFPASSRT